MKTTLKKSVVWLLILIMAMSVIACEGNERNAVKNDVIKPFQTACNEQDVKGMLRCFNPTFSEPILTAMGIADLLGVSGYLERVVGQFDHFDKVDASVSDFLSSLTVKPSEYVFNDTKDTCNVSAVITYRSGSNQKEIAAILHCVKKEGKWYLNRIGF